MARRHPSGSRSTGARRPRRPGAIAAASGLPSPYRLHDQDLERHLATGEHSALLAQYFGDDEYAHLRDLARQAARRPLRGAPRVWILPGVMGSKLGHRRRLLDDVIWLDPFDVVAGKLVRLRLQSTPRVEPLGVMLFAYLRLKLQLRAEGFAAEFYPYDWRQSIVQLGTELHARLLHERAPQVHLVAHSMGGLVARAALRHPLPHLGRLVMLGTPNLGSFSPAMVIRGTHPVLQRLAAFDLAHSAEELAREVFRGFPSVYELLPAPGVAAGLDLHQLGNWPRAGLQPDGDLLRRAAGLHSGLAKPDRERFVVIAGVNQPTVTAIRLQGDEFVFDTTPAGDGTVPLGFCELEDVPTYYIEEAHGALANNTAVGQAVVEILRQGTTTVLPDRRPAVREDSAWSCTETAYRQHEDALRRESRGRRPTAQDARTLLAEVVAPPGPSAPPALAADEIGPFEQVVVGRRRQRRLDVELALGSITEVAAAAAVLGIFPDVAPGGAAEAMDLRLGGAIREATHRRMFHGQVGELFVLPTGRSGLRTDFVVFAGLGSFASFSPVVLETVAENLLRTLLRSSVFEVATVLIGANSGSEPAVVLAHLLRGFVRGLVDADDGQQFRRLVLCEQDPERYPAMRQALFRLAATRLFDEVEITLSERRLPPMLEGPERGRAVAERPPLYLTVTTGASPPARSGTRSRPAGLAVRASLLGVGPKATVLTAEQRVASNAIPALLARIESLRPSSLAAFGSDLASTLLPEPIRAALADMPPEHPLVLIHDRESSRIPWELLRIADSYPALDRGLHRRYLAENLSVAKWLEQRRRDGVLSLLLVVNPTEDLEGAEAEGRRLRALFGAASRVQLTLRAHGEASRRRLLADFSSGLFDVIHYAGHAFFDPRAPARSGIVCAGREILSGADLAGLSSLPSLVFFNACEAGRLRAAPVRGPRRRALVPRAAARLARLTTAVGFAEAFLRGGVANYIGTYWPVDDAAAETFAAELYQVLLQPGRTVGEALRAARARVQGLGHSIDWANYLHYGNQAFALKDAR